VYPYRATISIQAFRAREHPADQLPAGIVPQPAPGAPQMSDYRRGRHMQHGGDFFVSQPLNDKPQDSAFRER
jgi:hypothetical protein